MAIEATTPDKSLAEDIDNDTNLKRTLSNAASNCENQEELHKKNGPADFETAMELAGFGTFNILLIICSVPAATSTVIESSVMSYVLPSAECDLKLTLIDKGLLNAITYIVVLQLNKDERTCVPKSCFQKRNHAPQSTYFLDWQLLLNEICPW